MRALLVEDDHALGKGVCEGLKQAHIVTDWVMDGRSAEHAIRTEHQSFDIIILDLGLPEIDGLTLLSTIRADGISTPVLILSAWDTAKERVTGFERGADDYLVKPFNMKELVARIHALTRRAATGHHQPTIIAWGIELNPAAHTATYQNESINLPRREFALLQKLMENAGKVLSREQLMQSIYGWSEDVDSNALEVHVHYLRKKFNPKCIRTIRGVGYMMEDKK